MIGKLGLYLRVGLATFFTCIEVWETFQNGFLQLHVLTWWGAAVTMVLAVAVEIVRFQRRRASRVETR